MPEYRFDEIAVNSKEKKKPTEADKYTYIGLEHLDTGSLTVNRWGSEIAPTGEKLVMHKGDVLFGKRRAYQKKVAIAPFDGIFSAHGMVLRPRENVITSAFFPLFISSDYFLDEAIKISVGSLSPTINWSDLKELRFQVPTIDEQKRLAPVIWAAIDTKNAYQKLLSSIDELVKSQFIEMFGDPTDNPKGWSVLSFDEVALIDANMTTDYEMYANYPHIGIDSIEKDTGTLFGYRTVKEDNVISGKYVFGPHHIIYSKIRPALNKVALPDFEGLCSADAYPILPKEGICIKEFLAHVLRSDYFLRYILAFSGRSQMPKVNRKQIAGFKFPVPPIDQQEEFVRFVKQSDKSKFVAYQTTITQLFTCMIRSHIYDGGHHNGKYIHRTAG